jgi:hypothetical protein
MLHSSFETNCPVAENTRRTKRGQRLEARVEKQGSSALQLKAAGITAAAALFG